jgi:hypothetical protein
MVFGLVGLGTNTFNELQQKTYLKMLEKLYIEMYKNFESGVPQNIQNDTAPDFTGKNISDAINEWLLYNESQTFYGNQNRYLTELVHHINSAYNAESVTQLKEKIANTKADGKAEVVQFINDFQKIEHLIIDIQKEGNQKEALKILTGIQDCYNDLYNKSMNELF